ncbi:hypothetical protein pb186bvf_016673 [Paramecium bursaria]
MKMKYEENQIPQINFDVNEATNLGELAQKDSQNLMQ